MLGTFVAYEVLQFAFWARPQEAAPVPVPAALLETAAGNDVKPDTSPSEAAGAPSGVAAVRQRKATAPRLSPTPAAAASPLLPLRRSASTPGYSYPLAAERVAASLAAGAAYLVLRRVVLGGDTLVKIYRKVENPIAFAESRMERLLSTAHLHWRYAYILAVPLRLSADWSFACIPPVASLADPRNLGAVALYGSVLAICAAAVATRHTDARLAAFYALGLGAFPFAPASNVFFYVGTFIGERLLYMPSVGFCLLLALPLARALCCRDWPLRRAAAAAVLCVLLTGYGVRTHARNRDWANEEALFRSALVACPDSAKVRLNMGILSRRYSDWDGALLHFRRAQEIEPGYCEPTYWIGATLINSNQLPQGLQKLEAALDCKYVAVEAAKALAQVYQALHAEDPTDPEVFAGHARLLTKMERHDEACDARNSAAELEERRGNAAAAAAHRALCRTMLEDPKTCTGRVRELRQDMRDITSSYGMGGAVAQEYALQRAASLRGFIREMGPRCRGKRSYSVFINELQNADPFDPWLHREWARLLALELRLAEAMQHLEASVALFVRLKEGKTADAERHAAAAVDEVRAPPLRFALLRFGGSAAESGPDA